MQWCKQDFFKRVAQKTLFPFKLFLKLAVARGGACKVVGALKSHKHSDQYPVGGEQKKVFQHCKRIISSNIGQFCGVDFLVDSFYWLLQFSVSGF